MISINIDPEKLKKDIFKYYSNTLKDLNNNPNKTFKITVDDTEYEVRYEVSGDSVDLFVKIPDQDQDLIIPDLNLNVGEILLPQSISLDDEKGYNPETSYHPHKVLGELSKEAVEKIYQQIKKTGLQNLII
jgi:hypothetical protein